MMQGSYVYFLDCALFYSRASLATRESRHIIEIEAI